LPQSLVLRFEKGNVVTDNVHFDAMHKLDCITKTVVTTKLDLNWWF